MITLSSIFEILAKNKGKIILGYSGGLDSTVLLDVYAKQAPETFIARTQVVHIHHGLSPNADHWSEQCAEQSKLRNLPFKLIKVNAKAEEGESPEAAARNARYQAFQSLMSDDYYLLTAHHQDDQVETFFLQLFRGAGIKGLMGMPEVKNLEKGQLIRPLLHYSRQQLQDYANDNHLIWIDDESNFDTSFQRNFLRHQVLPLIQRKWPGLTNAVLRTEQLCQKSNVLLNEIAAEDLANSKTENFNQLQIDKLLTLSLERRNNLMRYWISANQFILPSQIKLQQIEKTILHADTDANPIVAWQGAEIRRYRNHLYLLEPLEIFDNKITLLWDGKSILNLPNQLGTIDASIYEKLHIPIANSNVQISIRFRQGGETLKIPGRAGHHELKNLFQEWGIPPWLRSRVPLLYHNEELVGVCLSLSK